MYALARRTAQASKIVFFRAGTSVGHSAGNMARCRRVAGLRSSLRRHFAGDHSRGAEFNLQPKVCYYKTLNVPTDASSDDIKAAYQKLVKRLHPDVNPGSEEQFRDVMAAYAVLADPARRELYDTAIGVFDPDWGKQDSTRFWTGDHKQRMEEELARMKGAIFHPTKEQQDYLKGKIDNENKARRLTEAEVGKFKEKEMAETKKNKEDQDSILEIDGQKQDPERLHAYFKAKYINNPDVETVNPKEKLRFTKTIYNKVQERKAESEASMMDFNDIRGNFRVKKSTEDKIKSPEGTVLRLTAPFLLMAVLFIAMFSYTTRKPKQKSELTSRHISHGEGYIAKITPT